MAKYVIQFKLTPKNYGVVKELIKQGYFLKTGEVINAALLDHFSRKGFFGSKEESQGTEENETE